MERWIKVAFLILCFLLSGNSGATLILFQWDPGGSYPVGTTYDLSVNATDVTGIATNSYTMDLVSGSAITVQVRAVPPSGPPSGWTVVSGTVPWKAPSAPTGYQLMEFIEVEGNTNVPGI